MWAALADIAFPAVVPRADIDALAVMSPSVQVSPTAAARGVGTALAKRVPEVAAQDGQAAIQLSEGGPGEVGRRR